MPINKVMDSVGNVLIDLTSDTITPDKVLQGYTFHDRSGNAQIGNLITIPTGHTANYSEDNVVRFVDYDGEVIAEYSITEANALTTLPTPPAHERIIFERWNCSLEDVQTTTHSLCVGALYTTVDDAFYIKFILSLSALNKTSTLNYKVVTTGTFTVDWGDSTVETFTESSTGNKTKTHTYTVMQEYVIKITLGTGLISMLSNNSYSPIAFQGLGVGTNILELNIPSWQGNTTTGRTQIFEFYGMSSLQKYSISYDYIFTNSDIFYNCQALRSIIISKTFNFYISSSSGWYTNKSIYVSFPKEANTYSTNNNLLYNINRIMQIAKGSFISPEKIYFNGTLVTSYTTSIVINSSNVEYIYINSYFTGYLELSSCAYLKKFDIPNRTYIRNFSNLNSLIYETIEHDPTNAQTYFNPNGFSTYMCYCGKVKKFILNSRITQMSSIPGEAYSMGNFKELDMSTIETPPVLSSVGSYNYVTYKIKVMRGTLSLYAAATNWSTLYAAGLIEEATE